jgi:hypothetical protein
MGGTRRSPGCAADGTEVSSTLRAGTARDLPVCEREVIADNPTGAVRLRIICDFVAGLTELRASEPYALLTDSRDATILDVTADDLKDRAMSPRRRVARA